MVKMVKMAKHGQNGLKWSKIVPKWSKMVQDGPKWSKLVKNGKNDKNGQQLSKWPNIVKMA